MAYVSHVYYVAYVSYVAAPPKIPTISITPRGKSAQS